MQEIIDIIKLPFVAQSAKQDRQSLRIKFSRVRQTMQTSESRSALLTGPEKRRKMRSFGVGWHDSKSQTVAMSSSPHLTFPILQKNAPPYSQNEQVIRVSSLDRDDRNAFVECHQPPPMVNSQAEQVDVCQMFGMMNLGVIKALRVTQMNIIGPSVVIHSSHSTIQPPGNISYRKSP